MDQKVDVLVCAYNEADNIPRVLDSLRTQTVGTERFRVIFVDNASTDGSEAVVRANRYGLNLEFVSEPRAGKNWACNAGYRVAEADYVAHIDADAKADARWLENILRVIDIHQPDLCGGPYYPFYLSSKPVWFLDRYNSDDLGKQPHLLGDHEYLNGTNMVWRREIVEKLNGFSVEVGLKGRGLARGDETNLIVRARKCLVDFKAYYDPEIVVYHLTRPETYSMVYWMRRFFAQGMRSHEVWDVDRPQLAKPFVQLAYVSLLTLMEGAKSFVVRDKSRYPYWQNYWYETLSHRVYSLGRIWAGLRA